MLIGMVRGMTGLNRNGKSEEGRAEEGRTKEEGRVSNLEGSCPLSTGRKRDKNFGQGVSKLASP